jgi:uncharacterized phage protein (TIGR02220 family)
MAEVNSIENNLVILTKQTIDAFLKTENPADVIALYIFYYYTAKWQKTNQPKCTTNYVANGLKWSEARTRKIKKELLNLGLIENISVKDESGKISGHYIRLNYIIKPSTLEEIHRVENPQGGKNNRVENLGTNALSNDNLNALSSNKENALNNNNIKIIVDYLNTKAKTNFRPNGAETQKHIKARLNDGFTVEDFKTVIDNKCREWIGTDFQQYLRPATLFGTKFESYLNAKTTNRRGANGVLLDGRKTDDLDGIF